MESPLINGTIVSFSLIHVSRCNAKMPRQPFIQASAQNARGAGLVFANVGGSVCVLHSVGPGVVLHSVGAVLYPVLGIGSGQPGRLHSRAGGTFGQLRLVVRWSRYRQAQTAPRRRQREYRQYYLSLFHNISTNRLFPPTLVWKMKIYRVW